jgi:hypothetical protein
MAAIVLGVLGRGESAAGLLLRLPTVACGPWPCCLCPGQSPATGRRSVVLVWRAVFALSLRRPHRAVIYRTSPLGSHSTPYRKLRLSSRTSVWSSTSFLTGVTGSLTSMFRSARASESG